VRSVCRARREVVVRGLCGESLERWCVCGELPNAFSRSLRSSSWRRPPKGYSAQPPSIVQPGWAAGTLKQLERVTTVDLRKSRRGYPDHPIHL